MKKIAIIAVTEKGLEKALTIQKEFPKSLVITTLQSSNGNVINYCIYFRLSS